MDQNVHKLSIKISIIPTISDPRKRKKLNARQRKDEVEFHWILLHVSEKKKILSKMEATTEIPLFLQKEKVNIEKL